VINIDMKRCAAPRKMATSLRDKDSLHGLQRIRRDLTQPWDQASVGEIGGGLILVALIIAILRHWIA